ncbi:MAG: cystathionine gamma-synthase family protein [Algoriphagus sp.]|uniref:cystathionine gamma-synthase family protein n=1 Tax=Algoriphagus sp. TaxID=1872435 RepID=UPI00262E0396|nr:cystathionine gamma-synthase family protein [Algoriphagus sp.]MDG1279099.1 cystathionine gamma-synthase family protein [Algoriphagus sp.]
MKNSLQPESQMMSFGYKPELSEGAIKPPMFLTSTFVFKTAQEGKSFFEVAYGLREKKDQEDLGLIYSRINNPNLQILEERLCLWNKEDDCAMFESGMAAISTVFLEFLKPGDLLVYSMPTYGGTSHFIEDYLTRQGVQSIAVRANDSYEEVISKVESSGRKDRLKLIYLETPANPTNDLFDIRLYKKIADHFSTKEATVSLAVDNTYMGPLWSNPINHGADLVVYSATKFIGGHSDVIAGAVLGKAELLHRLKVMRTFLGNMASPHTCWLLIRSLETLKVRLDQQARNAQKIADALKDDPRVEKVSFLGHLTPGSKAYDIYAQQYSSAGTMISFELKGGEEEAFRFLNSLKLIKLAVSLGSTESLVQLPAAMTHIGMSKEARAQMGISDKLIRLSVGIEHADDLLLDIFNGINQSSKEIK